MDKHQFVQLRNPAWQRFTELCQRMERKTFQAPSAQEVSEFSGLFREVSNDLATIRSRAFGSRLEDYLNQLVARGHKVFYRNRDRKAGVVFGHLLTSFPRLLRRNIAYTWFAAALFCIPLLASTFVVWNNPSLATRVLPGAQLEEMAEMYRFDPDSQKPQSDTASQVGMSGFYVRNNVGIALRSFAGGILLGTVTVYVLLTNGLSIGVTTGYLFSLGSGKAFTSFVIGHGAFELTALVIAAGAGLMLGHALIHPGTVSRGEALRIRGLDAVKIASGAAAMLVIAAAIEAFWSPSSVPSVIKYIVGTLSWILVFAYLSMAGRNHEH